MGGREIIYGRFKSIKMLYWQLMLISWIFVKLACSEIEIIITMVVCLVYVGLDVRPPTRRPAQIMLVRTITHFEITLHKCSPWWNVVSHGDSHLRSIGVAQRSRLKVKGKEWSKTASDLLYNTTYQSLDNGSLDMLPLDF